MISSVLGAVIPTLIAIIGGAFYVGDRLGSLQTEVKENSRKIDQLQGCIDPDNEQNGGEE